MDFEQVLFENDCVQINIVSNHPFTELLKGRIHAEAFFRKLHVELMNQSVLDKSRNCIDLGAWIGDNTIPWAKQIQGIVYAIDPSPRNCEFIRLNTIANELSNVQILQTAISEKEEILTTNDPIEHASFVYNNIGQGGSLKVKSCSLDSMYRSGVLTNVGYIHLDVEGMEFPILRGATTLLQDCRPVITFEQHLDLDDIKGITHFLKQRLYKVYLIQESFPHCRPDCRNFIAFPKEGRQPNFSVYYANMLVEQSE